MEGQAAVHGTQKTEDSGGLNQFNRPPSGLSNQVRLRLRHETLRLTAPAIASQATWARRSTPDTDTGPGLPPDLEQQFNYRYRQLG
jgi:hypothetical protein